jgi:hypothetical protein
MTKTELLEGATDASLQLERVAFKIDEFCVRNNISRSLLDKLERAGLGPAVMVLGAARRITREAELEWQRARSSGDAALKAAAHEAMVERARHAGRLGVQSERHVSKQGRRSPVGES